MDISAIGEKIKKRRGELGLTQKQLAQKLSVSNQLVSKWETGESVPSLEYFDAICNALNVGFSYFTGNAEAEAPAPESGDNAFSAPAVSVPAVSARENAAGGVAGEAAGEPVSPEANVPEANAPENNADEANTAGAPTPKTNSTAPKPKGKRKFNLKLFLIILGCVLGALIIAGTAVLSVFVFVPAANKNGYLSDIENHFQNYFNGDFYNISMKTEVDGDVKDDYKYQGYFKKDGSVAFYNSQKGQTVADGILTYSYDDYYKYAYKRSSQIKTVEELAYSQIFNEEDDDEFDLAKIKYVRKVKDGYYLEMRDEYLFDEMTGTQKKNTRLTDKIRGSVVFDGGLIRSMSVTVKYRYKPDNEDFTVKVTTEFFNEKPNIAHANLENRVWTSQAVDDDIIKNKNEVDEEEFFSVLTDGKAKKAVPCEDFQTYLNLNAVKDGGDCLYIVDRKVTVLNYDLSVRSTESIDNVSEFTNAHVYKGTLYYTSYESGFGKRRVMYAKDLSTNGVEQLLIYYASEYNDMDYFGRYAVYRDFYGSKCIVYDLVAKKALREYDRYDTVKNIDGLGNVYYYADGGAVLMDKINGELKFALKGSEFYTPNLSIITPEYGVDNDVVYTCDGLNNIYRYEKGEFKEFFKRNDDKLKEGYRSVDGGYFIVGTSVDDKCFYADDGTTTDIGKVKLFERGQSSGNLCSCYMIVDVFGDKVLVQYDYKYFGVYDVSDLTNPVCFTKNCSTQYLWEQIKVYRFDCVTVVAIGVDGGYNYYAFNEN